MSWTHSQSDMFIPGDVPLLGGVREPWALVPSQGFYSEKLAVLGCEDEAAVFNLANSGDCLASSQRA